MVVIIINPKEEGGFPVHNILLLHEISPSDYADSPAKRAGSTRKHSRPLCFPDTY